MGDQTNEYNENVQKDSMVQLCPEKRRPILNPILSHRKTNII